MKYLFSILSISLLLILADCQNPVKTKSSKGLKDVAPFPIGTATKPSQIKHDSIYQSITLEQFNSLTAEGCMKMKHIYKTPGKYYWEDVDALVQFANHHDIRLHGHTLVWYRSTPEWMKKINDSAKLEQLLENYIQTYMQRYKGRVASWDVVNEGFSDSTGQLRKSHIRSVLGDDWIARMFLHAKKADSTVKLFYNDYSIEHDSLKQQATIDMIDNFIERGIPIDGVGFQMHTVVDDPSLKSIENGLKRFAKRGLLIHVSELDVSMNEFEGTPRFLHMTDSLHHLQKKRYEDIARVYKETVPKEQQWGITLWQFADHLSWIPRTYDKPDWPCIYDSSYVKKPAWKGFYHGLSSNTPE